MPDKVPENIAGPFYVTDDCISCGLCVESAAAFFRFNENESNAYVYKQPEGTEETHECTEALDACPVDAIRDDG